MHRFKSFLRSEPAQLLLLMVLLFAARSSFADHYKVPSGSMEYTLTPGDRVVVDKTAYGVRIPFTKIDLISVDAPRAGDVAIFDSPETGILLIKRIVAVAGDRVDLVDGRLWINGVRQASGANVAVEHFGERSVRLNLSHGGGPDIQGLVVPEDQFLALGDHRGNSHDGRYFGLVDTRELYGRAVAIYYSRQQGFRWEKL